ncbi:MAG: alpha/beta hydrolase [Ruminococcus sp.]|nr:alpha/beta hydrolase [Ruminococcus sp.]
MKKFLKFLKWTAIFIVSVIVICIATRFIIIKINNKTPKGGINETAFVEINGTKQWINIYGKDINNPVLLYLHGGPCSATSAVDWTCLRKLSDDYTVVNWDQRGCGHNYPDYNETSALTSEIMMQDGIAMTDYLRERFGKDKITIMGMSWGSVLGSNLVLEYPEKYDAMIAVSLVVDIEESQKLFKEYMLEKSADDAEMHSIAESIEPSVWTKEEISNTNPLVMKYSHIDDYFTESDINFLTTVLFNPYCSLSQCIRMIYGSADYNTYINTTLLPEPAPLIKPLELSGRTEYKVPFYLIEGKDDHGTVTMAEEAEAYFNEIEAPDKEMVWVSGGHNAPMMQTEKLAEFVHSIAQKNA